MIHIFIKKPSTNIQFLISFHSVKPLSISIEFGDFLGLVNFGFTRKSYGKVDEKGPLSKVYEPFLQYLFMIHIFAITVATPQTIPRD
jgi:hypothetical protein